MKKIRYLFRQGFSVVAAIMLVGITPAPVLAADPTSTTDPTTTTTQTQTTNPGNGPTGSAAHTFTYNATTGLWENDYYTYDPATQLTTPKVPLQYSCNPTTGKWDTSMWQYIAAHDDYEQVPVSVSVVPEGGVIAQACPAPVTPPVTSTPTDTPAVTPDAAAATTTAPTDPSTTNGTDPTDGNSNDGNGTSNTQNNTTGTTLNTTVASTAASGNALAVNNNNVGTVNSGNAQAMANVINLLQSQAAFADPNVNTFTANIQGNVNGDFVIDPTNLAQPAGVTQSALNNAQINNVTNGTINNNIVLNATSGDATAKNNNNVAGVSTGDASAIADVINMINSVVAANQSFIGTINIYGDYTGNILMPANSLNALLASAGTNTAGPASSDVTNTDNMAINNNVNLAATTGTAKAGNNNNVANTSTGNAMTNLTILNLTGKQVVAANSLLVFVNVLGTWVGLIMNAPAGTTSAALGGGVSTDTPAIGGSNITNTGNYAINNNITANATTGNAQATNNNNVGSVATGNALASVSLANLINSNFSLSNWFGVLFINVFGSWHGNFAVMQPPVVPPITSGSATGGQGGGDILGGAKMFAFVPTTIGSGSAGTAGSSLKLSPVNLTGTQNTGGGSTGTSSLAAAVLGASRSLKPHANIPAVASASFNYWTVILLAVGSAGLGFVAYERIRTSLRGRYISKI